MDLPIIEIVNKSSTRSVAVVVQRIGDRERHPNGLHVVAPGQSRNVIVEDDMALSIEGLKEPVPEIPAVSAEEAQQ